jgi:hypothetical protein
MDTITHIERRCRRANTCAGVVAMPFADRLAAHMFLGNMVALGVKALVRRVRVARWPNPMPHGTCVH